MKPEPEFVYIKCQCRCHIKGQEGFRCSCWIECCDTPYKQLKAGELTRRLYKPIPFTKLIAEDIIETQPIGKKK